MLAGSASGPARQATLRQRIVSLFVRRGLLDQTDGEAMRRCKHGGSFSPESPERKYLPEGA